MTCPVQTSCHFGPLLVSFDARALVPRAWTLRQSEWAAELCERAPVGPILELCAGVGHIGLAAAVLAGRNLVQVEVDPVAAEFARLNAGRAGWSDRVDLRRAPLLDALTAGERFPVIIADPPYLRSAQVASWPDDPPLAIDGGVDGLNLVRVCLELAALHLEDEGQLLLQLAGPGQDHQVQVELNSHPHWNLAHRAVDVVDEERVITLIVKRARR